MGIGCEFLRRSDVMGIPGKKKDKRCVDETAKDWWIENILPHESGGEDSTTAKYEEKEGRSDEQRYERKCESSVENGMD